MEYDRVSYAFSQEDMDGFRQDMDSIRARLQPALVILNPELRRRLQKAGDKTHPFVEQGLRYAIDKPHLRQAFLDIDEYQRDWDLTMQMKVLVKEMETLMEGFIDTYLAAGADAYANARKFYDGVKSADKHNVPDATAVRKEMSKRFVKEIEPEEEKKEEPETQEQAADTTTNV
jgi:hypothetical protein